MTIAPLTCVTLRDITDLRRLLSAPMPASDDRLGEILRATGDITASDLEQALALQRRQRRRHLGRILIEKGLVEAARVYEALAHKFGFPSVRLDEFEVAPDTLGRLPADLVARHLLLPLAEIDGRLVVAMECPFDTKVTELLRFHGLGQVTPVQASARQLALARSRLVDDTGAVRETGAAGAAYVTDDGRAVVRLVQAVLTEAVARGASDINLRPDHEQISVWYRIDGALRHIRDIERPLLPALVSRIKVIGRMNIAERRLPQEGRAVLSHAGEQVDLRISVIPTVAGESVVIRILDRSAGLKPLGGLGLPAAVMARLERTLTHPHGLFLVTGPTGSGKSTTLYAAINEIRKRDVHVLTVEDPVEYDMTGIEQVSVAEAIGLGFPEVLRRFLRHDPDVIMVGEIRDGETAAIACQAALTGHFVLSTLHTNDAPSTVARLIDMGTDPCILAATLRGVMAQRLIRLVCPRCRVPDPAATHRAVAAGLAAPDDRFCRGGGCASCGDSGYAGRAVVCEVLTVTPAIAGQITAGAPADLIAGAAREAGMGSLFDHALQLARAGRTSLDMALALKTED